MSKPVIALIDDEPLILDALRRLLFEHYSIEKFDKPQDFIERLKSSDCPTYAVIVSDQKMPIISGAELFELSLAYQPKAIRILLTGYTDPDGLVNAINQGQIYRYLNKPWDPIDFKKTIDEAVTKFNLEEQITQAHQALKSLDEAKTKFMILINHELKTPLTGILSFLQLLKETPLPPEATYYLGQIEKNAERLKDMVFDSLLIIGAEGQTLPLQFERFHWSKLDLQLNQRFETIKQKKNLTLFFNGIESSLVGDPKLISQALRRLLENAVRFANESTTINLEITENTPHRAQFTITNYGPSISSEVIKQLGQPFNLAGDIMKHSQGTGLGLAVVSSLLKLHKSELLIENKNEQVSISFQLPCL